MKMIWSSFKQMIACIKKDFMLYLACALPVLLGVMIRFGVPALEKFLCGWLVKMSVLEPYYILFDICFLLMTAFAFCFVAAMVVLEDVDNKITNYLFVTPLGKTGYLISHFVLPAVLGFLLTIVFYPFFHLTAMGIGNILFCAVTGLLHGLIAAMLMVSVSSNKLEGMTVAKVVSLEIFGYIVPYFIAGKLQYIFG
ncbi:MAG: ABC transporter permease, partial [Blautia sp.]|nr:ABC transporter permease [Blautia sp.]